MDLSEQIKSLLFQILTSSIYHDSDSRYIVQIINFISLRHILWGCVMSNAMHIIRFYSIRLEKRSPYYIFDKF